MIEEEWKASSEDFPGYEISNTGQVRSCRNTHMKLQKELAELYGVSQSVISTAVNRKAWNHVK